MRRQRITAGKRVVNGSSTSASNTTLGAGTSSGSVSALDPSNSADPLIGGCPLNSPSGPHILEMFLKADRARRGNSNDTLSTDTTSSTLFGNISQASSSSASPPAASSSSSNVSETGSSSFASNVRASLQQAFTRGAYESADTHSSSENRNSDGQAVTYVLERNTRAPRLQLLTSALVTLSNCPNLSHISLANTALGQDTLVEETGEFLSERGPRSPESSGPTPAAFLTLTTLTVSKAFEILLDACPKLISLDLSGCDWVTDELVAQLLTKAKRLRHLNLNRCAKASWEVAKLWFEEEEQPINGSVGDGEGPIAKKFCALLPALRPEA
ncbi:hypothetical protein HDU86_004012 [Geranomyces michiganensis]|nr:hypothetical protein HDU86_004012 [Geranomyces michiganensis]